MALDDLPGTIRQRQLVADSGSSDEDEDFGTFAMIKSGKDKKEALREVERRKNLQALEQAAEPPPEQPVEPAPAAQPAETAGSKRPRRGAAASPRKKFGDEPAGATADDEPVQLEADDAALARRHADQRARLQKVKASVPTLDEDVEEVSPRGAAVARSRPAAQPSSSSSFPAPYVWLRFIAADTGEKVPIKRCPNDKPLEVMLQFVAASLGFLEDRLVLKSEDGQALDVRLTPLALGLRDRQPVHVEEREPPTVPQLKLKLAIEGRREPLVLMHPADGSFGDLLRAGCRQAGLEPSRYRLQFDGDLLDDAALPASVELENDEMLELVARR